MAVLSCSGFGQGLEFSWFELAREFFVVGLGFESWVWGSYSGFSLVG